MPTRPAKLIISTLALLTSAQAVAFFHPPRMISPADVHISPFDKRAANSEGDSVQAPQYTCLCANPPPVNNLMASSTETPHPMKTGLVTTGSLPEDHGIGVDPPVAPATPETPVTPDPVVSDQNLGTSSQKPPQDPPVVGADTPRGAPVQPSIQPPTVVTNLVTEMVTETVQSPSSAIGVLQTSLAVPPLKQPITPEQPPAPIVVPPAQESPMIPQQPLNQAPDASQQVSPTLPSDKNHVQELPKAVQSPPVEPSAQPEPSQQSTPEPPNEQAPIQETPSSSTGVKNIIGLAPGLVVMSPDSSMNFIPKGADEATLIEYPPAGPQTHFKMSLTYDDKNGVFSQLSCVLMAIKDQTESAVFLINKPATSDAAAGIAASRSEVLPNGPTIMCNTGGFRE